MGRHNDVRQLAEEYYNESRQTFFENRLDEAALLAQNALNLYKQAEDYEKYTSALNLMGVIYAATGNETMAIDYYIEGLEYAIDYGYNYIVPLFYNNIGSRYQELNEHSKAIDYFVKAVKELENPRCMQEERYSSWCLVTYLNLVASYREMERFELADKYMRMAEEHMHGDNMDMYKYTFLILKCQLCWCMGESAYIYDHMTELLESGENDSNASDYVQDMRDLCRLFRDMKEYDNWKQIILAFEKYALEQNTVYFKLILTEMWMDYYKTIGVMQKYIHLCVDHAELYRKQKEINDKERAMAIDIKIQLREKEAERKRAEEKSTTDALTGLGNRYLLEEEADKVMKQAAMQGEKVTVGVLDIDCFKQHNDTYGHIQGDQSLAKIAEILKEAVADFGEAYRFGGDEFVIVLPQGDRKLVETIAKDIQRLVKEADIQNINSYVLPVITVSQGYACFVPSGKEEGNDIIGHADKALYYVKEHGRNDYHIIEE